MKTWTVSFLTRNGFVTAPSKPKVFDGAMITLPIGPPNTVAWVVDSEQPISNDQEPARD